MCHDQALVFIERQQPGRTGGLLQGGDVDVIRGVQTHPLHATNCLTRPRVMAADYHDYAMIRWIGAMTSETCEAESLGSAQTCRSTTGTVRMHAALNVRAAEDFCHHTRVRSCMSSVTRAGLLLYKHVRPQGARCGRAKASPEHAGAYADQSALPPDISTACHLALIALDTFITAGHSHEKGGIGSEAMQSAERPSL